MEAVPAPVAMPLPQQPLLAWFRELMKRHQAVTVLHSYLSKLHRACKILHMQPLLQLGQQLPLRHKGPQLRPAEQMERQQTPMARTQRTQRRRPRRCGGAC